MPEVWVTRCWTVRGCRGIRGEQEGSRGIGRGGVIGQGAIFDEFGDHQGDNPLADGGHPVGGVGVDRQVALDVPQSHVGLDGDSVTTTGDHAHAGELVFLENLGEGRLAPSALGQ